MPSPTKPFHPSTDAAPFYSGRWAILAIAATAIGMTGFAWWYWYSIGQRALTYWGVEPAMLIQRAPQVELLAITRSAANPSTETLTTGGETYHIRDRRVLTSPTAPGLGHVRASFLRDAAYAWNERPATCQPDWQYVLRFTDGDRQFDLWLALDCPRAGAMRKLGAAAGVSSPPEISIRPIAERLRPFLEEQFAASTAPDSVDAGSPAQP